MNSKTATQAVEFKTAAASELLKTGMITHDQYSMLIKRVYEDTLGGKDVWVETNISPKKKKELERDLEKIRKQLMLEAFFPDSRLDSVD
jgi:hypothetical protein